jgi:hypothetical protein
MSKIKGKNNPINFMRSFDATYKSRQQTSSTIKVDMKGFLDDLLNGEDKNDLKTYVTKNNLKTSSYS